MPRRRGGGGRGRGGGGRGRAGGRGSDGRRTSAVRVDSSNASERPCEGFLKWFDPAKGFGFVRLISPEVALLAENHTDRMQI